MNASAARALGQTLDKVWHDLEADKLALQSAAKQGVNDCPHLHVILHYKLWAMETRHEPAEYICTAECKVCGERMSGDDVPEDAETEEE